MQPLPHHYSVDAALETEGSVRLSRAGLAEIRSAPPAAFGGPGDQWSPEELLLASVADCFGLTFRAVARASELSWTSLDTHVDGVLARADRQVRFTEITVHAELVIAAPSGDPAKAQRLLAKAEKACLVSNSLSVPVTLEATVKIASAA